MEILTNKAGNKYIKLEEELVLEHSMSPVLQPLGVHKSTMELFTSEGGVPVGIEWDIPSLDDTRWIGLWFDGKILTDYDGVFSLPKEVIEFLEKLGYNVDYAKDLD